MTAFRKMMSKNKPHTATTSTLTIIFILNYFVGHCTPQLYEGSECELKDGSLGICKSFVLCRWAIQGLNQRVISYRDLVRCSFEGANEIICCGDERPTPSEKPDSDTLPIGTSEDGIYFDPVTTSHRSVIITTPHPPLVTTIVSPFTTSQRSVKTTTNRPLVTTTIRPMAITTIRPTAITTIRPTAITTIRPLLTTTIRPLVTTTIRSSLITTTTKRVSTTRPQTTRPSIRVTTQPILSTTVSPINRNNTSSSGTKPTVHSFWSEWSPNNDVETLTVPSTNSIKPSQGSNNSNNMMSSLLQEILNEAISSKNTSSTTQRTFERLVQVGDGINNIDNGESNNDLSFSRQKTTSTPNSITPMPTPTPARPPTRLGQRRSEIACENYTSLSSPFLSFNILGGVPTALGEFPHMAALGFPSQEFGGNEFDFNCGGSVISENYILTAAHCVTDRNLPTIIRTGKITLLTNDDGVEGVTSNIAEIIPHPNYRPSRRYDDIALIRVSSPIPFGDNIRPACLRSNMSDIDPSIPLIVTGWGRTSVERAERSNALLKTNLTGVTLESCNSSLLQYNANDRSLRNGVNLGQICAFDPQARQDSCEGDSGGPLQIYDPNGMSTIVGVTSFGISCGSSLPSVYARVAFYLDWIESIVWPNR